MLKFSLLAVSVIAFGCVSHQLKPVSDEKISLDIVEKLQLNKMNERSAISLFGVASLQVSKDQENKNIWLYYFSDKPKRQRMNLTFDSQTHLLKSIVWFVQNGEPESNLKVALAHYPQSHFKKHTIYWQQNDFTSSQTSYVDNSKGVVVEVFEGHEDEVSSLSWTIPGTIKERDGYISEMDSNKQFHIIVDRRHSERSPATQN